MNNVSKKLVSICSPVFNEIEVLPQFYRQLSDTLSFLSDYHFEIVFVLDPSTDGSEEYLRRLCSTDSRVKLICLSRRFGQAAAVRAGIDHAEGDAVIVLDSDLQDPPEVIPEMVFAWEQGSKVVIASRSETKESSIRKRLSTLWYLYLNRFGTVPIPRASGDYRLLDRQVVLELGKFTESHSFLRGLVAYLGFPTTFVNYKRPERVLGKTKYSKTLGSMKIVLSGALGFSVAPLYSMFLISLVLVSLSTICAVTYLGLKLLGTDFPEGNVTLFILISVSSSLNYLFLGVLSLYIAYIGEEVKRRPLYVVEKTK